MKKILFALGLGGCIANLFANVGVFGGIGSNLTLDKSEEIQMQGELVRIDIKAQDAEKTKWIALYDCDFLLRNFSGNPVSLQVGFPLTGDDRVSDESIEKRAFKVSSDSNTYTPRYLAKDKENSFSHLYSWDMNFAPKESISLNVSYSMGGYFGLDSTAKTRRIKPKKVYQLALQGAPVQGYGYVTRTANSWAGDVESAKFIFNFKEFEENLHTMLAEMSLGKATTEKKKMYEKLQRNGQIFRLLDSEFKENEYGLYVAEFSPKEKAGFHLLYYFTLIPRDVVGLEYLIEAMQKLSQERKEDFTAQDIRDLKDIILEFYGIETNNENIREFLANQKYYKSETHTAYVPKIDEELKLKLQEP